MKIAIITPVYPPYRGGIGQIAALEADWLKQQGHEVEVFKNENSLLRIGNAGLAPQLFFKYRRYDCIHLHYPFFGAAEYVRQPRAGRLVITYHMDTVGAGFKGAFFKWYAQNIMPKVLARADRIMVSSFDYLKQSAAAPLFFKNHSKFYEVPFGVDEQIFYPAQNKNNQKVKVLFVGGLDSAHYFKGLHFLLKAMAAIDARYVELLVVGDGNLRKMYEKTVEHLGLNGKVIFLGAVADEVLPNIYREADIFVFPSIDASEAFGLVVLEAMASGLPVVASNLPGVRTLVRDGETGFLFAPGDVEALKKALMKLLKDRSCREQLGGRGRLDINEKYSIELWHRRLSEVLFGNT